MKVIRIAGLCFKFSVAAGKNGEIKSLLVGLSHLFVGSLTHLAQSEAFVNRKYFFWLLFRWKVNFRRLRERNKKDAFLVYLVYLRRLERNTSNRHSKPIHNS